MAFPDLDVSEIAAGKPRNAKPISNALTAIQSWGQGNIVSADISDGAITTRKLGTASVETVKIKDGAVTNDKIADNAVETVKIKDGAVTNDKLAKTNGHLVFTPDANKLVKIAVLRKNITTNSYVNNSVILTGWTYVQGNNDTAQHKDISFGITFSDAPIVLVSTAYKRQPSPPANITQLTSSDQRPNAIVGNISTTKFQLLMSFGYIAEDTQYHGATWIAIGQLS